MRFFVIALVAVVAASVTLAELAPWWAWAPGTLVLAALAGDVSTRLDVWFQRKAGKR